MEKGKDYPEGYIDPTECASWIKRLLDQKKVTPACMSRTTPRGDKVEDLIKRADQAMGVDLFDSNAPSGPTVSLFEKGPPPNSGRPLVGMLEQNQLENSTKPQWRQGGSQSGMLMQPHPTTAKHRSAAPTASLKAAPMERGCQCTRA